MIVSTEPAGLKASPKSQIRFYRWQREEACWGEYPLNIEGYARQKLTPHFREAWDQQT